MSNFSREEFELVQLILESLEGDIQKDRFDLLETQIKTDPAAAQQYLDQVLNHAVLMWRCDSLHVDADLSESPEDTRFLSAMGEYERTAPAVQVELPDELPQSAAKTAEPVAAARQINKFSLITAITSLAALVFVLVYIEMHPVGSEEPMAVIADSLHAVWADGSANGRQSDVQFYKHTGPLDLKEGYIKIAYDCGTEVVVEGPARFEITGPKDMSVSQGQLYARSPFSAIGFTVSSPHVKIVDLGTEFGVKVAEDGTADVHMLKGKASLIAGLKNTTEIIQEGKARRVDTGEAVKDIRLQEDLFARQISSQAGLIWRGEDLDLADLVGGGSGLGGGQIGKGINLGTGKPISVAEDRVLDGRQSRFIEVYENPIIDGVFVPDRSPGDNPIVTSAGHRFRQCPDTSGWGFGGIYLGRISQESAGGCLSMVSGEKSSTVSLQPAICLYGNAGITFDLDAVRAAIPQSRIGTLRAVCGLSSPDNRQVTMAGTGLADIFVLVDGSVAYELRAVSRFSEPRMIRIPIGPKDRFVTLVATDGGDNPGTDWVVFAQPCLELTLED